MIRKLRIEDREKTKSLIRSIDNFSIEEKEVAIELVEESLSDTDPKYYHTFIYEIDDKLVGYYCIGKRALTDGVFDLYWIVVDPKMQNKGKGKELLDHAENFVQERTGRWILAETSSKSSYDESRNFYLRNNYSVVAEIKDFYSIGDNLLIFGKYVKT